MQGRAVKPELALTTPISFVMSAKTHALFLLDVMIAFDITDQQFQKLVNIKKENKRKRECKANLSVPVTTVPAPSTSSMRSPPIVSSAADLAGVSLTIRSPPL